MRFIPQEIPEVVLIDPTVHGDERGYFVETFRQDLFDQAMSYKANFVQDNESKSSKGVLRGLHYQLAPYAQSKLVRVIQGKVLDIAVDIRSGSPTFGKHVALELSEANKQQVFVPRGFAHGFVVLSETATFVYKVDNYYSPKCDRGIAYNDQDIAIDWILADHELQLSDKDKTQPALKDMDDLFEYTIDYYE